MTLVTFHNEVSVSPSIAECPAELLRNIFSHLDGYELMQSSLVNAHWSKAAREPKLWQKAAQRQDISQWANEPLRPRVCARSAALVNLRAGRPSYAHRLSSCPSACRPTFSTHGTRVVVQTSSTHAGIWDVLRGSELVGLDAPSDIRCLAIRQDGRELAIATELGGDVIATQAEIQGPLRKLSAYGITAHMAWTGSGATLVTASALPIDNSVDFHPVVVHRFDEQMGNSVENCGIFLTGSLGLTPDGGRLVVTRNSLDVAESPACTMMVFYLQPNQGGPDSHLDMDKILWHHGDPYAFSPNGDFLGVVHREEQANRPSTLNIVSVGDSMSLHWAVPLLRGAFLPASACTAVALSDQEVALGYQDGFIEVLDRSTLSSLGVLQYPSQVTNLGISRDGSKLAAAYADNSVWLRDFGPP